jgi:hypothetical protein
MTMEVAEGLSLQEIIGVAKARERIRSEAMELSRCVKQTRQIYGSHVVEYETHYELPDNHHQGE